MTHTLINAEAGIDIDSGANEKVFADPFALMSVIWKGRLLLLAAICLGGTVGVAYAMLSPSWFRAETTLLPVDRSTNVGGASLLGQLGGLAALAGVSVGGSMPSEPLAVLESREFVRGFVKELELVPVILSPGSGRLSRDSGKVDPDDALRDAVDLFDTKIRSVVETRKNNLVVLRVEWTDPVLAARWANLLAHRINQKLRDRALDESRGSIEFLRKELAGTQEIAVQQTIGSLLKSEMEKQMVARGNPEFAFRIVDLAEVPKARISPRRTLIVIGSAMLAGLLALLVVVLNAVVKGRLSRKLRLVPP